MQQEKNSRAWVNKPSTEARRPCLETGTGVSSVRVFRRYRRGRASTGRDTLTGQAGSGEIEAGELQGWSSAIAE